jgi:putative transcriptional regulator
MDGDYLTNQFLVAMPALGDPNFSHTVTLICEHTRDGALGIVVNRPLEMTLGEVFDQLELVAAVPTLTERPVLRGGPVRPERGFVLHSPFADGDPPYDTTLNLSPTLQVTTSRDILVSIARGEGPRDAIVALGYAGWGAGQLEDEIRANAWLNVPADPDIIFSLPFEARWQAAMRLLGVDSGRLSSLSGRA